jgi:Fur family ferric uptake transcriptional regulator
MERDTAQRRAIREVFTAEGRPLSHQEVLTRARKRVTGMGIATVYRTIKQLVEDGSLIPVDLPGQCARYELAGLTHHHHFACRGCERVFDLPGCTGHLHTHLPAGFLAEEHAVVVYGMCEECRAPAAGRAPAKPRRR